MPSAALAVWAAERSDRLDEMEASHAAVGGTDPGRRWATRQLNRGYFLLIASEFQGACRDLHSEAAAFVASQAPTNIEGLVERNLTRARKLDGGNANPGNIGSDFAALGVDLWPKVLDRDARNGERKRNIERLNVWRNAIAHDSTPSASNAQLIADTRPTLKYAKRFRAAADALLPHLDEVVRGEIEAVVGTSPW